MANDNFFKEEKEMEENQELENEGKIKLGDKEYDQDELSKLVGLGEIAREAEEKYNVKIDGIWPKFQQTINENGEFKKQQDETKKLKEEEELKSKATKGEELSPEEQRRQAKLMLKELGVVLEDDLEPKTRQVYYKEKEVERLKAETEAAVREAGEKYGIKTSVAQVIEYMTKPENPKHPMKAIKDMFEEDIDKWKEQELMKVRRSGYKTIETSAAGSTRMPQRKPVSADSLASTLGEFLQSRGQN